MASNILATATDKVKEMAGTQNKKVSDLAKDTKDVHDDSWKMTSDFGTKQSNTDHWLGVNTEDQTGPMLLEDPFGREKVWRSSIVFARSSH
jgi:catalase